MFDPVHQKVMVITQFTDERLAIVTLIDTTSSYNRYVKCE